MSPDDALERELEDLRPRPVSPELRRRIGGRLARRRRPVWAGLTLTAAAAGIALAVFLHRPPETVIGPPPSAATLPLPSVQAYRLAAAKSTAALDDSLDEQAVRTGHDVTSVRAGVVP